ncbi:MAG: anti-sigma factor [Betaproteobacteria bacterium]
MDLSRPDRQERLDRLAAEYALGTLSARPRARLARMARSNSRVGAALREWEYRLASLAEALPGVAPAPRVWARIVARLGLQDPAQAAPSAAGWWNRLALWRTLTAAGFAAALALGVSLYTQRPVADSPIVAVLAGPDGKPALIASARRDDHFLLVKAVGAAPVEPGKALQLWMLPEGQAPHSPGVLPPGELVRVSLPTSSEAALAGVPALAISLEPAGGSPTGLPTGPVLYSGKVERMF